MWHTPGVGALGPVPTGLLGRGDAFDGNTFIKMTISVEAFPLDAEINLGVLDGPSGTGRLGPGAHGLLCQSVEQRMAGADVR